MKNQTKQIQKSKKKTPLPLTTISMILLIIVIAFIEIKQYSSRTFIPIQDFPSQKKNTSE